MRAFLVGTGLLRGLVVLFGVADRPVRASGAEQALFGRPLEDAAADAALLAKLGMVPMAGEEPMRATVAAE